jgi:hypothetical protein
MYRRIYALDSMVKAVTTLPVHPGVALRIIGVHCTGTNDKGKRIMLGCILRHIKMVIWRTTNRRGISIIPLSSISA